MKRLRRLSRPSADHRSSHRTTDIAVILSVPTCQAAAASASPGKSKITSSYDLESCGMSSVASITRMYGIVVGEGER